MTDLTIREAREADLRGLLELYTQLHGNDMPEFSESLHVLWHKILANEDHHIILGLIDGEIISSCVLVVVRNLTRGQRPYGFIENVVTHSDHRNKGYATRLMGFAREIARMENCYKIMLLTGSKQEGTLCFYEKAGYNREDKTGFIQWL